MAGQHAVPTMLQQSRIDTENPNLSGLEIIFDYLARDATNVIFTYLNMGDVEQLLLCSRRLAQSPELHGLIRNPRHLHRLDAQCQGQLRSWSPSSFSFYQTLEEHITQCPNGLTSHSATRYCESAVCAIDMDFPTTPLPPDDNRRGNSRLGFCYGCTGGAAMTNPRNPDRCWDMLNQVGFTTGPLCNTCSGDEIAQHPLGCNTCTCVDVLRRKWTCLPCSNVIAREIKEKFIRRKLELKRTHYRITRGMTGIAAGQRNRPAPIACPKCQQSDSGTASTEEVAMCLVCDGIVYVPESESG